MGLQREVFSHRKIQPNSDGIEARGFLPSKNPAEQWWDWSARFSPTEKSSQNGDGTEARGSLPLLRSSCSPPKNQTKAVEAKREHFSHRKTMGLKRELLSHYKQSTKVKWKWSASFFPITKYPLQLMEVKREHLFHHWSHLSSWWDWTASFSPIK